MWKLDQVDGQALAAEINGVINLNLRSSQRCACLGPTTVSFLFLSLSSSHMILLQKLGKSQEQTRKKGKYFYKAITSEN